MSQFHPDLTKLYLYRFAAIWSPHLCTTFCKQLQPHWYHQLDLALILSSQCRADWVHLVSLCYSFWNHDSIISICSYFQASAYWIRKRLVSTVPLLYLTSTCPWVLASQPFSSVLMLWSPEIISVDCLLISIHGSDVLLRLESCSSLTQLLTLILYLLVHGQWSDIELFLLSSPIEVVQ